MITASAARRTLRRKARRAELARQIRAGVAAVACEESAVAGQLGEAVEVRAAYWRPPRTPENRVREMCERPCSCDSPDDERCGALERELALWDALVWRPEAAAVAARFRPDDRPGDSAWARLRPVLEVLGVLSPLAPGPLPLPDRWLEVCLSRGPPARAAARGSRPWIPARCMGVPVT